MKHLAALTIGAFVLMIVYIIAKLAVAYPATAGNAIMALWLVCVAYIVGRAYLMLTEKGR